MFKYEAYTKTGEKVSGFLEVDSAEAAEEALWQSDLIVTKLRKRLTLPKRYELLPTLFGVKVGDVIAFTQELASLLDAGIALVPALRLLQTRVRSQMFRDTVESIIRDVETGIPLSDACAKYPKVFPFLYPRLLAVAEETGGLQLVLRRLAAYMEKGVAAASKIKRALAYPSMVVVMGIGAGIVLLTFSLPSMISLFQEYEAELPLSTKVLMGASNMLRAYGLYFLAALVGGGLAAGWYSRTPAGARRRDRLLMRLPVVGNLIAHNNLAQFGATMSTLLTAGLSVNEGLEVAIKTTSNTVFQEAVTNARTDLLTGSPLSTALSNQKLFPPLMTQMVAVGEETSTLESNFEALASFYEGEVDKAMATIVGMIEPVIIIVVGLGIGFVAMTVMSSMYSIIQQIG